MNLNASQGNYFCSEIFSPYCYLNSYLFFSLLLLLLLLLALKRETEKVCYKIRVLDKSYNCQAKRVQPSLMKISTKCQHELRDKKWPTFEQIYIALMNTYRLKYHQNHRKGYARTKYLPWPEKKPLHSILHIHHVS